MFIGNDKSILLARHALLQSLGMCDGNVGGDNDAYNTDHSVGHGP